MSSSEEQSATGSMEATGSLEKQLEAARVEINRLQAENVSLLVKLDAEKQLRAGLEKDVEQLRRDSVNLALMVEQEEEMIANTLLKKIEGLQKEKEHIMRTVEEEEEYITNTLQKKLNEVRREKVEIENALEQEQEFIVNKLQAELDRRQQQTQALQAQLDLMRKEKVELENALEQEQELIFHKLQKKLTALEAERLQLRRQLSRSPQLQRSTSVADSDEIERLKALLQQNEAKQLEREREYQADQEKLRDENLHLRQRVARELERCKELERDLTKLESDMEMEEEMQFNMLTSSKSTGTGLVRILSGGHSPRPSLSPRMTKAASLGEGGSGSYARSPSFDNSMKTGSKWWAKRSEPHSHQHKTLFAPTTAQRRHSTDNNFEARRVRSLGATNSVEVSSTGKVN